MSAPQTACVVDTGVIHPAWCNPDLCRAYPAGDVVHTTETTWRTAAGEQVELRITQIHCAENGDPDAPYVSISVPHDPFVTSHDLTPTEAREVADRLRTYATEAGK